VPNPNRPERPRKRRPRPKTSWVGWELRPSVQARFFDPVRLAPFPVAVIVPQGPNRPPVGKAFWEIEPKLQDRRGEAGPILLQGPKPAKCPLICEASSRRRHGKNVPKRPRLFKQNVPEIELCPPPFFFFMKWRTRSPYPEKPRLPHRSPSPCSVGRAKKVPGYRNGPILLGAPCLFCFHPSRKKRETLSPLMPNKGPVFGRPVTSGDGPNPLGRQVLVFGDFWNRKGFFFQWAIKF